MRLWLAQRGVLCQGVRLALALILPLSVSLPERAHAKTKPPPAVLHVPDSVKRQRSPAAIDDDPPSVFSLMPPEVMSALGQLVPTPGAWVEYGVRAGTAEESRVRLSVLAPALPGGRYWLELVIASSAAMPLAVRILAKGDPNQPGNVLRMLLLVAGQAPLELPVGEASDALEALGKDEQGRRYAPGDLRPGMTHAKVEKLGQETVTVRAGTYSCDKLRITDQRTREVTILWKSSEVPVLPLVRAQGKARSVELLSAAKTGAHTLIEEAAPAAIPQGNGSDSMK